MKKLLQMKFMLLLCALIVGSGTMWAGDVLTLDCATPAPTGSTSTALSAASDVATFLNSAAGLSSAENKITCSDKTGDIYKGKGSGGGDIPQQCLKVGKASGGGSFTFTIPNNYDEIDEVKMTCYGWKTSSSISVNGGTAQTFTTAQTVTTKTFELSSSSRTIAIAVTSSAVCITEIVLKKSGGSTTFKVTYNGNDATSGEVPVDNNEYAANAEVTVLGNTGDLAKTGCAFDGWNTQANGGGTTYAVGSKFNISANTTLYAKWTPYTITALSNNESYGTVSLSDNVITGSPNSGYRYADPAYTVAPENSATVVQDGNTFTVTPTANTTITINFEVIPTHTATFSVNGTTTTTDFQEGAAITFPANPADIEGKSFVGWTETAISGTTDEKPTFVTSATMGEADVTYYAVFAEKTETAGDVTKAYGFETESDPDWTISGPVRTQGNANTGDYSGRITTNNTYVIFNNKVKVKEFSFAFKKTSNNNNYNVYIETSTDNSSWTAAETYAMSGFSDVYSTKTKTFEGNTEMYIRFHCNNTTAERFVDDVTVKYDGTTISYSGYCTTVAADTREEAGLGFVESTVIVEWYNAAQYTGQALTNPNSVSPITWTSSNEEVATVEDGTVKVLALGETTIKASFDGDENYKKGEASYTLTVQDSRTALELSFDPESVEVNVNETVAIPTLNGNLGNGAVTYASDDANIATVTEDANTSLVVTGLAEGTTTITATVAATNEYKEGTATFTVTVIDPNAPGTENNPYTVAEARAAIDAGTGLTNVYATGIVSQTGTLSNGAISYYISDDGTTTDQLQAYKGKGIGGANFTSADDIQLGDIVVIKGNLKKYNSIYEFDSGNQLVSLERPSVPAIIVADATINVNASSQSITRGITVNNLTISDADNFHIKYYNANDEEISDPDWIEATVTVENSAYVLSCTVNANDGEARTAYLKVYAMNGDETIYSNLVTITQAQYVPDYATLPFEFDGGKDDIESTSGLTQNGLGTDYSSKPKLKFDSTGDYLVLKIDEAPGKLTFDIVGNSFSGGTFKVQTSADGETFTDLASYTDLGNNKISEEFDDLDADVRYIKWIYTSKSSGNVGLGNINLAKPSTDPVIRLAETSVEVDAKQHDGTIALTYKNLQIDDMEDFSVQFFSDEQGTVTTSAPEWVEALVAEQDPSVGPGYVLSYVIDANDGAARTAYLRVNANDGVNSVASDVVTITQKAPQATYRKVTSTVGITSGKYLIVYEEESKVFNGSLGTLDAANNCQEVVINDNEIKTNEAIYFTIDLNAGTLQSASGKYIGKTGSQNGLDVSEESTYTNTFSIDASENAVIKGSGGCTLRFNSASNQNRFRYYGNGQQDIQLYKEVTDEEKMAISIAAACTDGTKCYSTFSSSKPFIVPDGLTVSEISIQSDGTMKVESYDTDDVVPADRGVMVSAQDGGFYEVTVPVTEGGSSVLGDNNALRPTGDDGVSAADMEGNDSNCKFYRLTMHDGTKLGFWWGADGGDSFAIVANKAYLAVPTSVAGARNGFAFGDDATGISNVNVNENVNGSVFDLQGRKVSTPGKGLYIMNGKKVVIK